MAATPTTRGQRQFGLTEWFGLRRHPLPDFYKSLNELPPTLSALAAPALPPGQTLLGALFVPAEYRPRGVLGWEYLPDRALIFLDGAALYARAEGPETPAETMLLDARSLLYVRSSLLLLYGLLEFKADCGAQSGAVRLEYNTVIWQALAGPLSRLIAAAGRFPAGDEVRVKAANASLLETLPFKFANGLRYYALQPGERLITAVFQPALWDRHLVLPFQVTPNTLFALTEGKVVLIEESRSFAWRRQPAQGEYGWIFTYIPRDRVVDMRVKPGQRTAELRLELAWGGATERRSFVVEPTVAALWERAWREAEPTADSRIG